MNFNQAFGEGLADPGIDFVGIAQGVAGEHAIELNALLPEERTAELRAKIEQLSLDAREAASDANFELALTG